MTRRRSLSALACFACLVAAAAYLHDPPWVSHITSGLRQWETDPSGRRFRWTSGHASFFVPSDATMMTLPIRAAFPSVDGRPVGVDVRVDDRWLTTVDLTDPFEWVAPRLSLPRHQTHRRQRRVDLRVSRTIGELNLGVQLGEIALERPGQGR
jgi:hypothetical protein